MSAPLARQPALRAHAPGQHPGAAVLLALAGFGLWRFPSQNPVLVFGCLALLCLCWRYPGAWICLLPALLPLADLTPSNGRRLLQEIDLGLLVLLAAARWHGQFTRCRRLRSA